MWRARAASSSLTTSLISGRQPTGPSASPPSSSPVGVCRISAGSQGGAQDVQAVEQGAQESAVITGSGSIGAASLCTTVRQRSKTLAHLTDSQREYGPVFASRDRGLRGLAGWLLAASAKTQNSFLAPRRPSGCTGGELARKYSRRHRRQPGVRCGASQRPSLSYLLRCQTTEMRPLTLCNKIWNKLFNSVKSGTSKQRIRTGS